MASICLHCGVSFKTSELLLHTAKGHKACAVCLFVFPNSDAAFDHLYHVAVPFKCIAIAEDEYAKSLVESFKETRAAKLRERKLRRDEKKRIRQNKKQNQKNNQRLREEEKNQELIINQQLQIALLTKQVEQLSLPPPKHEDSPPSVPPPAFDLFD